MEKRNDGEACPIIAVQIRAALPVNTYLECLPYISNASGLSPSILQDLLAV